MNIKSIAILLTAISGVYAANYIAYTPGGAIAPAAGRPADEAAAIGIFTGAVPHPVPMMFFFKNPNAWITRPANFIPGLTVDTEIRDLDRFFDHLNSKAEYYRDFKIADITRFIHFAAAGGGNWTPVLQHNIMKYLDPALVSKVPHTAATELTAAVARTIFDPAHIAANGKIPTSFFNGCTSEFLKRHADRFMEYLEHNNASDAQNLSPSALGAVLSVQAAAARLTTVSFEAIIKDPKKRKVITPDIFMNLRLVIPHDITRYGRYVPNMNDNVFSKLANGIPLLHESWFKYMSYKQMKDFQSKGVDLTADTQLQLSKVGAQALSGVTHKQLVSFFKNKVAANAHGDVIKPHFWKRLDCNGNLRTAIKDIDIAKIPSVAFKYLTLKQRQAVLSGVGDDCTKIPEEFLLGKDSRYRTLKISKKCYEDMKSKEGLRFRALAYGLVDSSVAADLDPADIESFKLEVPSKVKGEDKIELTGVLALNILRSAGDRGTSILRSMMKDEGKAAEICAKVEPEKLRSAEWVQKQLSPACVSAIENDFDWKTAKELDPKVWQGFNYKQIKGIVQNSDKKWAGLRDNNYKGLAKNKEFANKLFDAKEKDEDDKVVTRVLFEQIPAEKAATFFDWNLVKHVENTEALVKYIKSLSPKALTGASRAYFIATFKPDQITDAQFGSLSDDVADASAYSTGMGFAETSKLSLDRCAALSAKFLGRMKPVALGAFSAEQLAAIPAESFALICGEKSKAFSHALSAEQKAALGSECEVKPAEDVEAGAGAVESLLALAAAAAGSAAILL